MGTDFSGKNTSVRNIFLIAFLSLEGIAAILLSVPHARILAITAAEHFLGRTINRSIWDRYMLTAAISLLVCLACQIALVTAILKNIKNSFTSKIFKVVPLRVLLCIAVGLVLLKFCAENITNQNFWFDETGQFWMAKGLNHYSKPLSPEGTIADVIANNAKYNLDPGGFTILLHFVTFLGNTPVILRILPFVFFLLSFILIVKIAFFWKPDSNICLLCGFVLFVSSLPPHYAFELRAYSMEMFAVLFTLYLVHNKEKIYQKTSYAFFSGLVTAVGITARYSVIISVMPLFFFIGYDVITRRIDIKKSWIRLAAFVFPVLVMMVLVYCLTLRFQNPSINTPDYVNAFIFKKSGINSILGIKMAYLIPLLTMIILFILFRKTKWFEKYNRFVVFAVIQNIFFIALSILGKYTWGINSRHDIATLLIFILAIIPALFIILDKLTKHIIFVFFVFSLVGFKVVLGIGFRYETWDSTYTNIRGSALNLTDNVLINHAASPTIRYLYEYGGLKEQNSGLYPGNFYYFDHEETSIYELTTDTQTGGISSMNMYDYVILSHYSESAKNNLLPEGKWENCAVRPPSYMYKRIEESIAAKNDAIGEH
jgi:hypothetical protein